MNEEENHSNWETESDDGSNWETVSDDGSNNSEIESEDERELHQFLSFLSKKSRLERDEDDSESESNDEAHTHDVYPTRPKEEEKIESSILKKIANALAEDDSQEIVQFCVTGELCPANINVEVDGLGTMMFPINHQYVQKLINISSKAKFGLRDQTILDENVRNTYEIKSDKLNVTLKEDSLICMLSKMRDVLGLSKNSVLIPHLHNMLVYGPGHFFDMHQDSEKLEGMVATLVIVLPAPHIGGDLIILHGKNKYVFSSENISESNAKCITFYTDCNHKVENIKEGYRIALTYNLVLKSEEICDIKDASQELINAVKDYFDIKVNKQLENESEIKLVYFLNHSYTEHSLRFNMLKGSDRANASAFYDVAQKLNLIFHLALVDVQQNWHTNGDEDGDSYDQLITLMESYVTLSFWLDSNNKKMPFGECNVSINEVSWTKETGSFEPYNTDVEGYTGNEGVTADYFYKRAAVVLWPKSSTVLMNFKLNYDNALDELYKLTSSIGNEQEVIGTIAKAEKYLHPTNDQTEKSHLEKLTSITLYIKDKNKAVSILSHYKWKILTSDIAPLLVQLQAQYGITWFKDLLNSWNVSIDNIDSFVQTFLDHSGAVSIIELLLNIQYNALFENKKEEYFWNHTWQEEREVPMRVEKTYQFLVACAAIQNIPLLDKVIVHLISNPKSYPCTNLADMFLKLQDTVTSEYFSNCRLLKSYLVESINKNLALEMESVDQWSIPCKLDCNCQHCTEAIRFLHSKTDIKTVWPLSKSASQHVSSKIVIGIGFSIRSLNLPIDMSEEKGPPRKLTLVKTEQVQEHARKRVDELKSYLQKLQK